MPYTPCPEPYPPLRRTKCGPKSVRVRTKLPSRLRDNLRSLGPKSSLAPLRTNQIERGFTRHYGCPSVTPFPLSHLTRPPSVRTLHKTKHTTFQPENVTTQCPILPLFSTPQEPWEALTRFTVIRKRSRKPHHHRDSLFPPKSDTHRCAPRSNICAWDFCTSDFVEHLLLHCLFEKSP